MSSSSSKISIIIPLYNTEKYISECIKSILNQTYKNIEIIIINDGSTDNSEEKCFDLQKTNKEIKYIYQSNAGVTAARKKGVEHATGEWITFVDADDILLPNAIQTLIEKSEGQDIVIGGIKPFNDSIKNISIRKNNKKFIFDQNQFIKILLAGTKFKVHGPVAKIFKKKLFNNKTFAIPPNIKRGEDFIMNIRLALKANSICYLNTIIYLYRQHNSSTIHTFKTNWEHEYLFLKYLLTPLYDYHIENKYKKEIRKRKLYCIGEAYYDKNLNTNDCRFIQIKKEIQTEKISWWEKFILTSVKLPPFFRYYIFRIIRKVSSYLSRY